jgi:hypothetical protein
MKICNEQNLYDREEKVRSILADLIENHYKQDFIYVMYNVWKRVNEIRVNEVLHSEIIRMAEVLKK